MMTIDPFVAGVLATIFAELVVVFAWAVIYAIKKSK